MIVMMFWDGGGWAWWQAGLMWIVMIAFWGVLIWAIYALIAGATRRNGTAERDARAILDERLARGEIDAEEYRQLLDGGTGRTPAGTGSGSGL